MGALLSEGKVKSLFLNLTFAKNSPVKSDMNEYARKTNVQLPHRNGFVKTIGEIFGMTAIMSFLVLTLLGIFCLSFFLPSFFTLFLRYMWLTVGLAVTLLVFGWTKPFTWWHLFLVMCGSFLVLVPLGPLMIEWNTGKSLLEIFTQEGYWVTFKATFVLVSYLMSGVAFITWMYLIAKGRRQNPMKWFRSVQFKMRQRMMRT